MTRLTELQTKATATVDGNSWHSWEVMADDGYTVEDAKFIAASNPQTILQMIALIEQMGEALTKEAGAYWFTQNLSEALAAFDKFNKGE